VGTHHPALLQKATSVNIGILAIAVHLLICPAGWYQVYMGDGYWNCLPKHSYGSFRYPGLGIQLGHLKDEK
jgi:hypothetical protein